MSVPINNYFYAAHLTTAAKVEELVRGLGLDLEAAAEALPFGSGGSAVLTMQARRHFQQTRHDRGTAYSVTELSRVVGQLRALAIGAHIPLEPVDAIVEEGLARQWERARSEKSGA